ncbi:MAG: hypothetical protein LIQ31_02270 [Planctomycetes bacterium]|nr:hypothetical protein [Planctomycetota bacterium]
MLAYVYNGVGDLKLQDVPMPVVEKKQRRPESRSDIHLRHRCPRFPLRIVED